MISMKLLLMSGKQFFFVRKINLPDGDKSVKKITRHFFILLALGFCQSWKS